MSHWKPWPAATTKAPKRKSNTTAQAGICNQHFQTFILSNAFVFARNWQCVVACVLPTHHSSPQTFYFLLSYPSQGNQKNYSNSTGFHINRALHRTAGNSCFLYFSKNGREFMGNATKILNCANFNQLVPADRRSSVENKRCLSSKTNFFLRETSFCGGCELLKLATVSVMAQYGRLTQAPERPFLFPLLPTNHDLFDSYSTGKFQTVGATRQKRSNAFCSTDIIFVDS